MLVDFLAFDFWQPDRSLHLPAALALALAPAL